MLKIDKLYQAPNGSQEPFELSFKAGELAIPEITGPVTAHGHFMRVEEGIMMLLEALDATQETFCTRCGKPLSLPLNFKPSEWLFYETDPLPDDDENEHIKMDVHRKELEPLEPVRQDLILNLEMKPYCKKLCAKFEEAKPEGSKGVKALAGLKGLLD